MVQSGIFSQFFTMYVAYQSLIREENIKLVSSKKKTCKKELCLVNTENVIFDDEIEIYYNDREGTSVWCNKLASLSR